MHGTHRQPPRRRRFAAASALLRLVRRARGMHVTPRGGDPIPSGPMPIYIPRPDSNPYPRMNETRFDLYGSPARPYVPELTGGRK